MSAHIYIEGAESKEDQIRCREGFRRLLESAGFTDRLPRLSACGSRNSTFNDFKTALANSKQGHFVAMLVDSEDPVEDVEKTWSHLKARDRWDQPVAAVDDQVFFMTTCMETWIVADRETLRAHYRHELQENALPSIIDLEKRSRQEVHDKLKNATRNCSNAYQKGKRSFEVVGKLDPSVLTKLLPSFNRAMRVLHQKLG